MSLQSSNLVTGLLHALGGYLSLRNQTNYEESPEDFFTNNGNQLSCDWAALKLRLLTVFTAGVCFPWLQLHQLRRRLRLFSLEFSTFELHLSSRDLILNWIVMLPLFLLLLFSLIITVGFIILSVPWAFAGPTKIENDFLYICLFIINSLFMNIIIHKILFIILSYFYMNNFSRVVLRNLRFRSLRFQYNGSFPTLIWLFIGNFIINIGSIGTLHHLMERRTRRYWEQNIFIYS
jgi:uncharacterized membrane protein YjgN (DUF898 family)